MTFAAGAATATVTVDPTTDSTVEADETVILTLAAGTGYNVASPGAATGTISNDDIDVSLAVSPASVAEDGATNLVYTFTRTGDLQCPDGQLQRYRHGGQYRLHGTSTGSQTVTFAAGAATATVTVDPTVDSTVEADETVILTLAAGTGYNVASPGAATGTISNDDIDVIARGSPASVAEDGATNLVYTFTRTAICQALTVNYTLPARRTIPTTRHQHRQPNHDLRRGSAPPPSPSTPPRTAPSKPMKP